MVTEVSSHKKLFSSLCVHIQQKLSELMALSRKEKPRIVVELHSQGKAYREIAHEVRMSLRDVSSIIKRSREKNEDGL
jgi:DNA-directed RNA polymerase specialized sigma24 family protein